MLIKLFMINYTIKFHTTTLFVSTLLANDVNYLTNIYTSLAMHCKHQHIISETRQSSAQHRR